MRVGVRQWRVAVPVAVLHLGTEPGVLMRVVAVVVAVCVHVFDLAVDVVVLVLGAHDCRGRRNQQHPARELCDRDRLAEGAPRERSPGERGDSEASAIAAAIAGEFHAAASRATSIQSQKPAS